MTPQTTASDSVDLLDELKEVLDAEQALAEAEAAEAEALEKLGQAKKQRDMHPGSKWDWETAVEDAEKALEEARKRTAEARKKVRELLEGLAAQAAGVSGDRKRQRVAGDVAKKADDLSGKVAPDGEGQPLGRDERVKGYLALLNAIIALEDLEHDAAKEALKRAAQALGAQQAALDKVRAEWQARADQDANNIEDPVKKARAKELAGKSPLSEEEEAELHTLITENVAARHLDNYNKARQKVTDARAELDRIREQHKAAVDAARAYLTRVAELSERIARWLEELGDDPALKAIAKRMERKRELIAKLADDVEKYDSELERFIPRAEPSSWELPGSGGEQFIGKPGRDRLLVGALAGAVAVLLLSGAALIYGAVSGSAAGGTSSSHSGTPTNAPLTRELASGEQRPINVRFATDGSDFHPSTLLSRDLRGEEQPSAPRDVTDETPTDMATDATPTPQPTPTTPDQEETIDDFTAEPTPTATPGSPPPASDDFTSEPEPTPTYTPPSASDDFTSEPEPAPTATPPTASDELASEPEPTEEPEPPATTNDIVAQPEPSPTPVPPAPSDELATEPTATPAPLVNETVTLDTSSPSDGETSDTTLVAPVEP